MTGLTPAVNFLRGLRGHQPYYRKYLVSIKGVPLNAVNMPVFAHYLVDLKNRTCYVRSKYGAVVLGSQ